MPRIGLVLALVAGCSGGGPGLAVDGAVVVDALPDAPAIDAPATDAPAIDAPAIDAPADAPVIDATPVDASPFDAVGTTTVLGQACTQGGGECGDYPWSCSSGGWCGRQCLGAGINCAAGYTGPGTPTCFVIDDPGGPIMPMASCYIFCSSDAQCPAWLTCTGSIRGNLFCD